MKPTWYDSLVCLNVPGNPRENSPDPVTFLVHDQLQYLLFIKKERK
jgi:hypothetical protein